MSNLVTLTAGPASLVLAPDIGGSIVAWRHHARDLLRPTSAEMLASGSARRLGCYPLVPFSNRVANAQFIFDEAPITLKPSDGFAPLAIHGDGWLESWQLVTQTADSAVLSLDHAAGAGSGWPWDYRATQSFALTPDALAVTMAISNRSDRKMPAGLGLHPYFPLTHDAEISATCQYIWLADTQKLPTARAAAIGPYDLSRPRHLADLGLDHCFGGWHGTVLLTWPSTGQSIRITADPLFDHLVVASPLSAEHFAVEPVTHANAALNRTGEMAVLEPGETLTGTIRFSLV